MSTFSRAGLLGCAMLFASVARADETSRAELLLGDFQCTACHAASPAALKRIIPHQAPRLDGSGTRITPQWIQAYLAKPDAAQPGTRMSDKLAGLPEGERASAIESLTHFLMSRQGVVADASDAGPQEIDAGRKIYHRVGCVACHQPFEAPGKRELDAGLKSEIAKLAASSIRLPDLSAKTTVNELAAFLQNPLAARPSGRMPSLSLSGAEAHAVAAYLLRDQLPAEVKRSLGLKFSYYEPGPGSPEQMDKATPKATGMTDRIDLTRRQRGQHFSLRFSGAITVPAAGDYVFFVSADDGAWLFVDGKLIVDNGGIHPDQEREGHITLTAGEHAFVCYYFDGGGQIALRASWQGPGQAKQEIPASAFTHGEGAMKPVGTFAFTPDPDKVARGKELFATLKCAACHDAGGGAAGMPLASLQPAAAKGCLADEPAPGLPRFALSADERTSLRDVLSRHEVLEKSLHADAAVDRTMTAFNCYACHARNDHPGPQDLRRDYFVSALEVDLGDEGRLPPHLTGAGEKLRRSWLTDVLFQAAAVRPYLATRMPAFGEANLQSLPQELVRADAKKLGLEDRAPAKEASQAQGRRLVGTGGLSCIICHNFDGRPSLGVPAMDMVVMEKRLNYDWFRAYLLNPQSLRPGTRMPGFWPEGRAANRTILDGDTELQIASIWAYLGKIKGARRPEGMDSGSMELIADTEAIIYRNFIEGCGPRGIAVGYPEKVHLAFDADFVSMALLWQGAFMDAARHRTGRGVGAEPPLGDHVIRWVQGSPLALLDQDSTPWPKETWRSASAKFLGYELDAVRRPTFHYRFGDDVDVRDYPVAFSEGGASGFRRAITLSCRRPPPRLFFRAARAGKIEERDGAYIVDEHVKVTLPDAHPVVRTSDGASELLVPVTFKSGKATITEVLSW